MNDIYDWINHLNGPGNSLPLVQTMPFRQATPEEKDNILQTLYKHSPLYAGTVTIGCKKILRLSTANQKKIILSYLSDYAKTRCKFVATLELTTQQTPHLHMLISGYKTPFAKAFKELGSRNAMDISFQEVKHVDKYVTYMFKEQKYLNERYYTNIIPQEQPQVQTIGEGSPNSQGSD